jgi:hypothetical protein
VQPRYSALSIATALRAREDDLPDPNFCVSAEAELSKPVAG